MTQRHIVRETYQFSTAWRRSGAEWARSRAWPSYDGDRSDGGLPLTCRRLWERESEARAAHGLA